MKFFLRIYRVLSCFPHSTLSSPPLERAFFLISFEGNYIPAVATYSSLTFNTTEIWSMWHLLLQ